jgi:hypothetical protein
VAHTADIARRVAEFARGQNEPDHAERYERWAAHAEEAVARLRALEASYASVWERELAASERAMLAEERVFISEHLAAVRDSERAP